jgi:hypothetical protein
MSKITLVEDRVSWTYDAYIVCSTDLMSSKGLDLGVFASIVCGQDLTQWKILLHLNYIFTFLCWKIHFSRFIVQLRLICKRSFTTNWPVSVVNSRVVLFKHCPSSILLETLFMVTYLRQSFQIMLSFYQSSFCRRNIVTSSHRRVPTTGARPLPLFNTMLFTNHLPFLS